MARQRNRAARSHGPSGPDDIRTDARERALDFVETCAAHDIPGAYRFYPETGGSPRLAIALAPDAAGRSTTDSQDFRALSLSRDRQGRPLRDTYDGDGRRLTSAAAGETLRWDAHGLVEYAVGARARVFAPPLPGVQLSRRSDGQWEAALVTPTQTPLAVVPVSAGGAGAGPARLQAIY